MKLSDKNELNSENTTGQENGINETEENFFDNTEESVEAPSDDSIIGDGKTEESENRIESADEKTEEIEENRYTTDEDDIAYVAERITGARHSVVTTAAPVRVRENNDTIQMNSLRRIVDDHAAQKSVNRKQPKLYYGVLTSAFLVIAVLVCLIIGVAAASDKNRPADINIGETSENAVIPEIDNNSEISEQIETEKNSESEDNIETDSENNTESESNAEPETETEPEKIPEAEKFNVTLDFYDRDDIEVSTERITLNELLDLSGVELEDGEVPSLSLDSVIAADIVISIDKYEYKTVSETSTVPYESQVYETDLIPRGEKRYSQYGEEGQVNKYYTVEYVNGEEKNRTFEYEETIKYPVNEIYEEGVGGSFVGSDGVTYTYSYRRVVPATYYNIEGLTYLGTMADESVIAVDMDNIPLGTRLYVKNSSYDFGVRIASDIGGQVDDWEIDIWLSKDNPQYQSFAKVGYHYDMEIYYID